MTGDTVQVGHVLVKKTALGLSESQLVLRLTLAFKLI